MKFKRVEDVKGYMNSLKNSFPKDSKWYGDLEWFSLVRYTTTSEYFDELMTFIERVIEDEEFREHKIELMQLYDRLQACFR